MDVRHWLTSGPVSCLASASWMKVDTPSGSDQDTSVASSTVHVEKKTTTFSLFVTRSRHAVQWTRDINT